MIQCPLTCCAADVNEVVNELSCNNNKFKKSFKRSTIAPPHMLASRSSTWEQWASPLTPPFQEKQALCVHRADVQGPVAPRAPTAHISTVGGDRGLYPHVRGVVCTPV